MVEKIYRIGEPITFSGYIDSFDEAEIQEIVAVQFSLDDGKHWTSYPVKDNEDELGISWKFDFVPQREGQYFLHVRALGEKEASKLISSIPFIVHSKERPAEMLRTTNAECATDKKPDLSQSSSMRLRAVGSSTLEGAKLFRSGELWMASAHDADLIAELGIKTIYDIRSQKEVSKHPDPLFNGVATISLEPADKGRDKNAKQRLVAGVIGEYGKPEERMIKNYMRYANEYPLIGKALRSIADRAEPCLVHCVNGKDRTGVVCAVIMRIAGFEHDDIFDEYLAHNKLYSADIQSEEDELGVGMTQDERKILRSFIEARPSYLDAFFKEALSTFGSFDVYVENGLHLSRGQREALCKLMNG